MKNKYEVLLNVLVEKIQTQQDDILFKQIQIDNLKSRLEEMENKEVSVWVLKLNIIWIVGNLDFTII